VHSPDFVHDLQAFEKTADSLISNLVNMGMEVYMSLEKDNFQEYLE
jgi:hypothetical protein